jgi:DNA-binding response OmpR family regulator
MDIKRARVMVVEDERIMSTFILTTLRRIGILDLFAFEDAASALKEVGKIKPDLLLTDIHMRPLSGLDLVRELRASADEKISALPVIFLSADSSAATVGETLPLGIAGYIVKPPNMAALQAKIEHALKGYQTTVF